jgi:PTS system nitrogen regulatory IIA component
MELFGGTMDIAQFLSPTDVIVDFSAPDKVRAVQDLSKRAASALQIDAGTISKALLQREELGSTGMGAGVAIPHARLPEVKKPHGILARLRREIDFAAIDGKPVDLVFLLLLPAAAGGEQLNVLASVARKLRNSETIAALRNASNGAAMYRTMVAD